MCFVGLTVMAYRRRAEAVMMDNRSRRVMLALNVAAAMPQIDIGIDINNRTLAIPVPFMNPPAIDKYRFHDNRFDKDSAFRFNEHAVSAICRATA